ncbi:MAG: hypothetical protein OEZ51_09715 [Nitrospinota bacterium]|nr:hypothetical protein [Nitrospinota bacterium]
MKTTKLIQTLAATLLILTITPAWAMDKDTGYPWYRDLLENDRQTVSKSGKISEITVLPSEKDTGYPWFADIKNDNKPITKPVTIFKSHPRTGDEDSGYPWYTDTKEDNPA